MHSPCPSSALLESLLSQRNTLVASVTPLVYRFAYFAPPIRILITITILRIEKLRDETNKSGRGGPLRHRRRSSITNGYYSWQHYSSYEPI